MLSVRELETERRPEKNDLNPLPHNATFWHTKDV